MKDQQGKPGEHRRGRPAVEREVEEKERKEGRGEGEEGWAGRGREKKELSRRLREWEAFWQKV